MNREELEKKKVVELRKIAKNLGIRHLSNYKKAELVEEILKKLGKEPAKPLEEEEEKDRREDKVRSEVRVEETVKSETKAKTQQTAKPKMTTYRVGPLFLELVEAGTYGFLRWDGFAPSSKDIYVPADLVRKYGLKTGDRIEGLVVPKEVKTENEKKISKYDVLVEVLRVNGYLPEKVKERRPFESLIPVYPTDRLRLETDPEKYSTRVVDLIAPIGKGQRALIVAPPKAGKTMLLKDIANAVAENHPEVKIFALLIDERPEEVTDFQRSVKGEVIYSTFDEKPENHIRVADMVLAHAKRLVEMNEDVLILLDSITRLARANNLVVPSSGKTLSGGLDPGALYRPKHFFGAARKIENGGSLTIVATALIDTGSRLDEMIYEEFKGTGNMEIHLDRGLANKRMFPAINIVLSGTRHEELLYEPEELKRVWKLRAMLSVLTVEEAWEVVMNGLKHYKTNQEFLESRELSPI